MAMTFSKYVEQAFPEQAAPIEFKFRSLPEYNPWPRYENIEGHYTASPAPPRESEDFTAEELMCGCLDQHQLATYCEEKYVPVRGSCGGRYKVFPRYANSVLSEGGKVQEVYYCLTAGLDFSIYDSMLAVILLLELDESFFLTNAIKRTAGGSRRGIWTIEYAAGTVRYVDGGVGTLG